VIAAPPPPLPPSPDTGATIARVAGPAVARARPGAGRRVARVTPVTSWSGHAQSLLVLGSIERDGRPWVKVLLPVRPNGTTGWIPRHKVVLSHTPYWIELRLKSRRMTVYRAGRRVGHFRAVIGAPGTPTPRGLTAIYERNAQPSAGGFLGPWVLSLASFSNVLENFGGGPGRVGIHGRGGASLLDPLGSARSHGCIRISNRHVSWLARRARPGTPVLVRQRSRRR
jgi:lipoprotein-anchoring transpeptidase ErfK/SrfK